MEYKGFTDAPTKDDKFNIKNYIDGISKFILTCNTPMTMSIQGDWGTGKTSIMELVKNEIGAKVNDVVWFNTWQFSQFNMGDKLPFFLLNKLINAVSNNQNELKEKSLKMVASLFEIGTNVITGGITNGKFITDMLDNDVITKIENLKENFEKLVKSKTGEDGRIVVFVDDLDRLEPKRAVELLEVLKIFLDCENCVFVLAIDYSVVVTGVKDKFGVNFDIEKGKSFFDKIIQVAFKMPIASYNMSEYIKKNLQDIDVNISDGKILDKYEILIKDSIGNNPRAMKRLFNSFYLLLCIASGDVISTEEDTLMLFSLLCMQSRFENIYNIILASKDDIDVLYVKSFIDSDSQFINNLKLSDNEKEELLCFMQDLYSLVDKDDDQDINEAELTIFKKVLNFSGMTNAKDGNAINNDLWEYREKHRRLVRNYIPKLREAFGKNFGEWKRNKYDVGNYWLYYNNWEDENATLKYGFQFALIPLRNENKSHLDIEIYRIGKTNISDLRKEFGDDPLLELKLNVEYNENSINYKNVIIFDPNEENEIMYELIKKSCEILLKHFK